MNDIIAFLTANYLDIGTAVLAILGGLKIIARYTKTKVDDKVIDVIEYPLVKLLGLEKK